MGKKNVKLFDEKIVRLNNLYFMFRFGGFGTEKGFTGTKGRKMYELLSKYITGEILRLNGGLLV